VRSSRPIRAGAGLGRQIRSLWPLAGRVAWSARRRNLLMAALVGLSLVFYCLYASYLDVTYRESGRLVQPVELPSDIVLMMPGGLSPEQVSSVEGLYLTKRNSVTAVFGPAATSAGSQDLLVLAETTDGRAPISLGPLVAGGSPRAGEAMVPANLAAQTGIGPGDVVGLVALAGAGDAGPSRLPSAATVCGIYQPLSEWLSPVVLVLGPEDFAAAGRPTMMFLWAAHADYLPRILSWLDQQLVPVEVPVPYRASRPVLPLAVHAGTAHHMTRSMQRAIYFPGGEAMFLLYLFFGAGIFTLMLLAYLDRRRELAVMKTLGLTSRQVALVLYLEVLVVAAAGLAIGLVLLLAGVPYLRTMTGQDYRVSAWVWMSGSALSVLALFVSVWLPIGMSRLATVANLLGGQPFRLAGYERRWGDGGPGNGNGHGADGRRHANRTGQDPTWTGPV